MNTKSQTIYKCLVSKYWHSFLLPTSFLAVLHLTKLKLVQEKTTTTPKNQGQTVGSACQGSVSSTSVRKEPETTIPLMWWISVTLVEIHVSVCTLFGVEWSQFRLVGAFKTKKQPQKRVFHEKTVLEAPSCYSGELHGQDIGFGEYRTRYRLWSADIGQSNYVLRWTDS